MENTVTRRQLKTEVKTALKGNWGKAILLNLVPIIFSLIIAIAVIIVTIAVATVAGSGGFDPTANPASSATQDNPALSFGTSIIESFFSVAISYGFLDWLRQSKALEHPFKSGLQTFSRKYFTSTLAITLLTYIFTFLWTLLFVIPGIIKSFSYSQAFLVYKDAVDHDNADMSYLAAITKSRELMNGHKWEYFVLQLSFIGWAILAVIPLGLGFLWLTPYINATNANFYRHLTE